MRLPVDSHVHSQWSYDTGPDASMRQACQQAVAVGLPAIAFTEHVDHLQWAEGDADGGLALDYPAYTAPLDVQGYLACVQRCREEFPGLRVLSGVEAGEAHLFGASLAAVLAQGPFDRVLGSVHALAQEGALVQVETLYAVLPPDEVMRRYLTEVAALVRGSGAFAVLAHLDYARRHWPAQAGPYDERHFEPEYREVLRLLAADGRALEVNTLTPLVSVQLLRWWRDAGGDAVSFGSDAHWPARVGEHFDAAVAIAGAAGFRPRRDPYDFWRA